MKTLGEVVAILQAKGFVEECPEANHWTYRKWPFIVHIWFGPLGIGTMSTRVDLHYEWDPKRLNVMRTAHYKR